MTGVHPSRHQVGHDGEQIVAAFSSVTDPTPVDARSTGPHPSDPDLSDPDPSDPQPSDPHPSDDVLVSRAVEGFLDAFGTLVERHADLAYRVAFRITGNHHDAEDVAQDSLFAAWQNLPRFRGESSFSTWLYRIVTRRALNRVDPTRRRPAAELLPEEPDRAPGPATVVERDLRHDAVSDAILALPAAQRVVLVLAEYEMLSYRQIAEVTGSSEASVRSHLFRGRRTLATNLAAWR